MCYHNQFTLVLSIYLCVIVSRANWKKARSLLQLTHAYTHTTVYSFIPSFSDRLLSHETRLCRWRIVSIQWLYAHCKAFRIPAAATHWIQCQCIRTLRIGRHDNSTAVTLSRNGYWIRLCKGAARGKTLHSFHSYRHVDNHSGRAAKKYSHQIAFKTNEIYRN